MYKNKAEELSGIVRHTLINEFVNSKNIALEIYSIQKRSFNEICWVLASIYQAGKIEGIREERAKTKAGKAKLEEIENIRYTIEQASSITSSVGNALYSGNDPETYAPALFLASRVLQEQNNKIEQLARW